MLRESEREGRRVAGIRAARVWLIRTHFFNLTSSSSGAGQQKEQQGECGK